MIQAKPVEPVILTIDAGGTSVRFRLQQGDCALCNDWSTQANEDGFPPSLATYNIQPDIIVAGITKTSRDGVVAAWQSAFGTCFPDAESVIVPDYELAAAAALDNPNSVMLLAGTGSLACVYVGQVLFRIGGRGWEYGDEGSGAFITTEVIRRCVRALDGMLPLTPLLQSIIDLSLTSDAGFFAMWAREQASANGRGFLIPHLGMQAERNNTEAINLFHGAGGWLARLAYTAHRRTNASPDVINVRAVGGLWDASPCLQEATIRALKKWFAVVEFSCFGQSNLDGGFRIAMNRHCNGSVPKE